MLQVRNLDVHYRGIQALRGVDITVKKGEAIHFRFPYGGIPTDGLLVDITLAK